jgi:hypothetical protein
MYNPALEIDFLALEDNWKEQPLEYMKVSQKFVDATAVRDELKLELEELIASKDSEARVALAENNGRVTEAMVSNYIINDEEVQAIKRRLLAATKDVNTFSAEKNAFEHRKKALECLVQLYATSYFTQQTENKSVEALSNEKVREAQQTALEDSAGTQRMRRRRKKVNG